jgi:ATP-dependent helicase HepA
MSRTGGFVQVEAGADGIGKAIELRGKKAVVEYFVSPVGPRLQHVTVPIGSVQGVELSPQTRVFWFDADRAAWKVGRVDGGLVSAEALRSIEDHYHVTFPNGQEARVPVSQLYVRWAHPIEDPTDYLADRVTDTPFFFDGRSRIVRYLSEQRAAFGGLTALASSAIELLPHQIAIVRRVLADPIERYLLADEVGLGKTIEAGILIRQHVLDRPRDARILVIVPGHLAQQWKSELATKFSLASPGQVTILAEDALDDMTAAAAWSMLVVDEAHRAALRAFDPQPNQRQLYERLRRLSGSVPRLLLLSGTPVLHQEDGFLAMLHLLDPDGYRLEDRQAFRRRVRARQTIAEVIADLEDNASPMFIDEAISRLLESFSDDARLTKLCEAVKSSAHSDEGRDDRVQALRALRTHVAETYRLHRRLLRTRREDPRVRDYLPRRTGVILVDHEEHARAEAFDFVEAWRLAATTAESVNPDRQELARLFVLWAESALSHPLVLARRIDARLALSSGSKSTMPLAEEAILSAAWCFDGEQEFLRGRRSLLVASMNQDERALRLAEWLQENRAIAKVIVFVDDSHVAELVASTLQSALGPGTVVRYDHAGKASHMFENNKPIRVLVCDASSEEGLNLQRVGAAVVHYDLPLEPARIEQRIGRVDRIEARGRMRNIVLSSGQAYEREWIACLATTVRVFDRSVAPLQYVLSEATARIRSRLSMEGAAAIEEETARLRDPKEGIDAELRRIRAQEALDSVEVDPERDDAFFHALKSADDAAEEDGEEAFDSWVVNRLQFVRRSEGPAIRYVHDIRRPTLVPLFETVSRFAVCLDRDPGARHSRTELPIQLLTFERATAEKDPRMGLVRVGHPFVEALEAMVRADDRGSTFAMWRHVPGSESSPRLFFRFDFVVEADIAAARALADNWAASIEALRRRADEASPIEYRTVWLDSDLDEVRDDRLLALLNLPYCKGCRPDGGSDTNLRSDRWPTLDASVSVGDWDGFCTRARLTAERLLRSDNGFLDRSHRQARLVRDAARSVEDALRSRIDRLSGPTREAEEQVARFESQLAESLAVGVETPSIRLDSAGAMFLAGKPWVE